MLNEHALHDHEQAAMLAVESPDVFDTGDVADLGRKYRTLIAEYRKAATLLKRYRVNEAMAREPKARGA